MDWPDESRSGVFIIGILGNDPFGLDIDSLQNETVRGRPIVVRRFGSLDLVSNECNMLFISQSEMGNLYQIRSRLKGRDILTVGETPRFAEEGGNISFIIKDNKVRFIINRKSIEREGLHVNAQLLMLAEKVIP
jgi:hypothetical protein